VVFANELLDNLPFGIAESDGTGWREVRVGSDEHGFHEVLVPLPDFAEPPASAGTRVPIPRGLRAWFEECERTLRRGFVVVVDYMTDAHALHLRTYRAHTRGAPPLDAPGQQDITADVVVDHLRRAASPFAVVHDTTQAEWLRGLGIDELAADGARRWREGAHRGDLEALAGRSHAHEGDALTDPSGLGAHRVVVLERE
jgi:SAM-dependent MidA family methyltransferase